MNYTTLAKTCTFEEIDENLGGELELHLRIYAQDKHRALLAAIRELTEELAILQKQQCDAYIELKAKHEGF